ncbi:MAG: polysaccharide deacetylase family protein [Myxococcales bacterium]|nr:polysaccharide deacetylase family protein [Myxococcales bacterium]
MNTPRTIAAFLTVLLLVAAFVPRTTSHAQAPVLPTLSSTSGAVAAVAPEASDLQRTTVETVDTDEAAEGTAEPAEGRDPLAADMADGRWTRGFIQHRIVHFTFDDGPRPSTTRRILADLDRYGIKATFFVVGRQLNGPRHAEERELLREMAASGHTIGTHTWDHSNLTRLSDAEIEAELDQSEAVFEETFGARPWLIRPPYGAHNRHIDEILAERHYTEVLWNISGSDTVTRDPDEMLASFSQQLDFMERHPRGPGGIILVHDTHEHTADAFPRMVEELRRRNCELLDQPGEELWDIADDPRIFFQPRNGNDHMATTVRLDDETIAARQTVVRAQAEVYCAEG